MRALSAAAAAVLVFTTPAAAFAEDEGEGVGAGAAEPALSELSERLADPEFQAQAATMAGVLIGTLMDMEVGPLAEAMDKATKGNGPDIDPDAKLRDLAPGAEDLPEQMAERLPEAMNAMSSMTDGMQAMLPALREMGERMREAMEGVRPAR